MKKTSNRKIYFVIGFLLGLFLSFYIPEGVWELVQKDCPETSETLERFGEDFEPHLNLINKPLSAKKPVKNVIRPRYYSSELGIREKLLIAVISSQDNIDTLATGFNRTAAHLVNKIKFFINADNVKASFKLKNIIGLTDTRENLRPFHILKYIADNYLDDYDYFLIIPDSTYVDAKKLNSLLHHLSISFDIYMGRICETIDYDGFSMESDRNYCDLDAGIILSSSVIRKIRANLDWCVRNAVTNFHSINIGKCVKYSSKVSGCQQSFQDVQIRSYKLETMKLYRDLNILSKDELFRNATIIYPIAHSDDQYILHAYFSGLHLELLKNRTAELEKKAYRIANGTISNNILEIRWPLGVAPSSLPDTRHDILVWNFLNTTHIFMPNHENAITRLPKIESEDFHRILSKTVKYASYRYPHLSHVGLHSAYRKFDPVRGMDYQLHIIFNDKKNFKNILKSFEVVKPLGKVEIVPSPFVTESTRIAILMPTFEHQTQEALTFVQQYEKICMQNQDNTFLLMIFLYRVNSASNGETDSFKEIKIIAQELTKKYKTDGSQIAWLSIRLPTEFSSLPSNEEYMLSSLYYRYEILSLAVTDLALRKIGLDSLVLVGSNSMNIKTDFLNRVRMNTIQNFQIFAPIGFMMYPCNFAHFCKECELCDIGQGNGYFDKSNYDVISFYSRDYVEARKTLENVVPIVRTNQDIVNLLNRSDKSINNIAEMFVAARSSLHILRGVEPQLKFGNAIKNFFKSDRDVPTCPSATINSLDLQTSDKCIHLASRKQIGDAFIRHEEKTVYESDKR